MTPSLRGRRRLAIVAAVALLALVPAVSHGGGAAAEEPLSTAAVGPGGTVSLQVTGRGGVPDTGVGAVVLNITSTGATSPSFITVWPDGESRPDASTLNAEPGQDTPNLAIVKVGANGRVNLYNDRGTGDLVADVMGWFPAGGSYRPLSPARVLDTRDGTGVAAGAIPPRSTISLTVNGAGGVPTSGVGAVVLNVTSTTASAPSFITVWPDGVARPNVSNLNTEPGQDTPNLVVVGVGASGRVNLYNDQGTGHLVADVVGWFPPGAGLTTLTPARILDTRGGMGAAVGRVGAGSVTDLQVTGRGGVPSLPSASVDPGAVVVNLTSTGASSPSFVTVWPRGEGRPNASTLNTEPGQDTPNLAIVKLGAGGVLSLYNDRGAGHLVADATGYLPATSDFSPLSPFRLLDTRDGTGVPAPSGGGGGTGGGGGGGGGTGGGTTTDPAALNAANTGPAAGVALTPTSGRTITTPGTVVAGEDIAGCLRIAASNVTVRDTRITCDTYNQVDTGLSGVVLERVEFAGQGLDSVGLFTYSPTTVRRAHFHGSADAWFVHGAGQVLVEETFFEDLRAAPGHHTDHIQVVQGSNIAIRGNRFVAAPGDNAAIFVQGALGPVDGVEIADNHISGGLWSVWCVDAGSTVSNCSIHDNVFVKGSASFGPITLPDRPSLSARCNTFDDGTPATLAHDPTASQTQFPNPCP